MKKSDFLEALDVISAHHSSKLIINRVKPNGLVDLQELGIDIVDCVPSVIKKLQEAKFTLTMKDGCLSVSKIG